MFPYFIKFDARLTKQEKEKLNLQYNNLDRGMIVFAQNMTTIFKETLESKGKSEIAPHEKIDEWMKIFTESLNVLEHLNPKHANFFDLEYLEKRYQGLVNVMEVVSEEMFNSTKDKIEPIQALKNRKKIAPSPELMNETVVYKISFSEKTLSPSLSIRK